MATGCPQSSHADHVLGTGSLKVSHADHAGADEVWTGGSLALGKTSSGGKLGASVAVVGLRAARLAHLDIRGLHKKGFVWDRDLGETRITTSFRVHL